MTELRLVIGRKVAERYIAGARDITKEWAKCATSYTNSLVRVKLSTCL